MKFTMFQIKLRRKVKMIYNLKQKNTEKDNFWNVLLEKVQERVQFSEEYNFQKILTRSLGNAVRRLLLHR